MTRIDDKVILFDQVHNHSYTETGIEYPANAIASNIHFCLNVMESQLLLFQRLDKKWSGKCRPARYLYPSLIRPDLNPTSQVVA